ncbi:PHB depolymerase family esterase [Mycolicibacterium sediminis]|uniref:Esterase n=2 Tax=Mycolicibacterium sediminis TaxID=1286180 RepID=A0A7I7QS72_9MYCO|nr:esterase [Mycolicibacterium sediminis]
MEFGGLQRTYLLHAPSASPAGLVINLHGAGMTGGEQAAVTNYDAVGDRHGFAVVYPDGIDFSWADGRGASVPDRTGVDDVGFLVALAEQISRDYGIDPGRVYATGMSAGGFMASRLACDRADVVAAIAPVAGTLGSGVPCAPSRPVSVLEVHGTADPVVPFNGGPMLGRGGASDVVSAPELARRWEVIDGCPGAPVPDGSGVNGPGVQRVTATGCAGGTSVSLVQIDGGGHTWPGSRSSLPIEQVGMTSSAFDASAASGQFFADHGR